MIPDLKDWYKRDIDIVRTLIVKQEEPAPVECTLEEELQPAAYREDVRKLLEEGKLNKRKLFTPYKLVIESKPF